MKLLSFRLLFITGFWLLAAYSQWALAAQMFRWVDENGKVHYSDQVPPKHSKYRRSQLNEEGMTVNVIEAAKTEEQLFVEAKLKRLREEKQRLLAEQLDHDRALLRTFRSEEDIQNSLVGKLSTVDVLINISNSNIERLQSQQKLQEKHAAKLEKNGTKVPKFVITGIAKSKRAIVKQREIIRLHKLEKNRISTKYEGDITRFRELVGQIKNANKKVSPSWKDKSTGKHILEEEISIFLCMDQSSCKAAWPHALSYVNKHATTPVSINNDKIVYTADPTQDQDISLSVSKIAGEDDFYAQLFLDVRCRQTSIGQELCLSEKVQNIRDGFKAFIKAQVQ